MLCGLPLLLDRIGHEQRPAAEHAQADGVDAGRVEPMLARQLQHAVDQAVVVAAAGVRLDRHAHDLQRPAQVGEQALRIGRVAIGVQHAQAALEDARRAVEAGGGQAGGGDPGVAGPAGVESFGPGAVGQILERAGGHRAGDAQGVGQRSAVEIEQAAGGHRGAEDAGHAGRMEAAGVGRGRVQRVADAHGDLVAGDDGFEQRGRRGIQLLGQGQRGGDHRHARVQRRLGRDVVELDGVRGRPVRQRRPHGRRRCGGSR